MKCPKCKEGEVKEQVSIKGFFVKRKEISYFCPLCDFETNKVFKLSKQDVILENLERTNFEKKTRISYDTRRGKIN